MFKRKYYVFLSMWVFLIYLSLLLPLLEKSLSVSPGLMGEVGDVGERGERGPPLQEGSRDGGRPGDKPANKINSCTTWIVK
jgi:hypothetical protein